MGYFLGEVSNSGWAEGECTGRADWFPFRYIEKHERIQAVASFMKSTIESSQCSKGPSVCNFTVVASFMKSGVVFNLTLHYCKFLGVKFVSLRSIELRSPGLLPRHIVYGRGQMETLPITVVYTKHTNDCNSLNTKP